MTSAAHKPLIGPAQYTPEWYALRIYDPERKDCPVVIGASEAAAACNVSAYGSALQLYLQKRQEMPAKEDTEAMSMGRRLEPVILDLYQDRYEVSLERGLPMMFHPEHRFMAASLDAQAWADETLTWAVDSKSSGFRMYDPSGENENRYGAEGTDEVPPDALLQAQQQMYVGCLNRVDFCVLFDARTMRVYTVQRNDDLIKQIISAEKELAERIVNGEPPAPNFSHPGTRACLRQLYGCSVGSVVELELDDLALWNDYQRLGESVKELEKQREELKNKLLYRMGNAQSARFPSGGIEVRRIAIKESTFEVTRKAHEQLRQRKLGK